ncbi:hypothetical protein ACJROX_21515 [Pseudalkalibacillus sp. A8]|uniref:hypothetical protein n=1 Tax=Pseudalkalibacillus sp. A8 TaxID=3382641 RepID=UPI0038B5BE39
MPDTSLWSIPFSVFQKGLVDFAKFTPFTRAKEKFKRLISHEGHWKSDEEARTKQSSVLRGLTHKM